MTYKRIFMDVYVKNTYRMTYYVILDPEFSTPPPRFESKYNSSMIHPKGRGRYYGRQNQVQGTLKTCLEYGTRGQEKGNHSDVSVNVILSHILICGSFKYNMMHSRYCIYIRVNTQ